MGGEQPRSSQGLKVELRGLDFGSAGTGEWGHVQMGVCWGDHHSSWDCGLHEGAETGSQATAYEIVVFEGIRMLKTKDKSDLLGEP